MRRAARGMSMVEMIVALAIVTIVLLVAGTLLVRLAREAEKQALRPPAVGGAADRALDQLESDARRASILRSDRAGEVSRLVLDMADGERVVWTLEATSLRRRREPLGGEPVEREMAGDVALAAWGRRSAHLLDLSIRRRDEFLRQRTVLLRNVDRLPGALDASAGAGSP